MQSIQSYFTNWIFRLMPADKPGEPHDYLAERKRNAERKVPKLPRGVVLEEIKLNRMSSEKLTKQGNHKGLIFYIHGGGFTTGSAKERRFATQYMVDHYGYDCISINYSLAPENKWPLQIEDCYEAYVNILKEYDAKEIVFMGESAGGTLVLSLTLLAKERGLPLPKAIVAFSPATDNCESLPSHTKNIKTDHMLKDMVAKGITDVLFDHHAKEEELKDPLLSPFYGDYHGLPPIFLSVSDSETLHDDTMILYDKLKKEGHLVMLEVKHGVCHAYQIMTYMPEAKETLDKTFAFLETIDK